MAGVFIEASGRWTYDSEDAYEAEEVSTPIVWGAKSLFGWVALPDEMLGVLGKEMLTNPESWFVDAVDEVLSDTIRASAAILDVRPQWLFRTHSPTNVKYSRFSAGGFQADCLAAAWREAFDRALNEP